MRDPDAITCAFLKRLWTEAGMVRSTYTTKILATAALLAAFAMPVAAQIAKPAQPSKTLDAVKARGELQCGVIGTSPGFSLPDSQGVMRGIDADQCRAIAAAVLGAAAKVKWVLL